MTRAAKSSLVVAHSLGEWWLARLRGTQVIELDVCPDAPGVTEGSICAGVVVGAAPALGGAFVDAGFDGQVLVRTARGNTTPPPGSKLLVQLTRFDPVKGWRATTDLALAGLLLVLVPGRAVRRVSRQVAGEKVRASMEERLTRMMSDSPHGWIARSAALHAGDAAWRAEAQRLEACWSEVAGPQTPRTGVVWSPPHPAARFVRERAGLDVERVFVDGPGARERATEALATTGNETLLPIETVAGGRSALDAFGLEAVAWEAVSPRVDLPGGGHLVIETTEALTAIDVNAGLQARGPAAGSAQRLNREAAAAVAREVILRNVGGLIVVDFVDMADAGDRREIDRLLAEGFREDIARVTLQPLTPFSLAQIAREQLSVPLSRRLGAACTACAGQGWLPGTETQARRLLRTLCTAAAAAPGRRLEARAPASVLACSRKWLAEGMAGTAAPAPRRVTWGEGALSVTLGRSR